MSASSETAALRSVFLCLFLSVCFDRPTALNALYVGDSCIVHRTSASGVCRLTNDCPAVLADINRQIYPTRCGFQNRAEIICCPVPVIVTDTRFGDFEFENDNSVSARKCQEYRSAVIVPTRLYTVEGGYIIKNETVCKIDAQSLIVGGEETEPSEFPHMALLGYGDIQKIVYNCGGSLISDQFVLTAAHCIRTQFGEPTLISLGAHSKSGRIPPDNPYIDQTRSFEVAEKIMHPDYNRAVAQYNDIALIRLQRRIELSPYIRPVCLPSRNFDQLRRRNAVATGWGLTEWHGKDSDTLMKVQLDLYTVAECNGTYTRPYWRKMSRGVDPDTQMCAGSRTEEKDTCQGDSGGPLQIQHPRVHCMYSVLGLTSFGRGCGSINVPNIYTRVQGFVPWIESIVWPNN